MTEPTDRVSRFLRPRPIGRLAFAVAVAVVLFVIGMLIGVGVAHAQTIAPDPSNPCAVPDPVTIRLYQDWQVGQKVSCVPAPIGIGTRPTIRYNSAGVHGWAWCPKAGGTWGLMFAAVTWERALQIPFASDSATVAQAADPIAALSAAADRNITTPLADPSLTPVWCPNVVEMYASRPADIPPPPPVTAWIVTPALSGSRPLFSIVNGALVATTQRVAALASPPTACDCDAAKLVIQTATYCAPVGKAPLVALCRMK